MLFLTRTVSVFFWPLLGGFGNRRVVLGWFSNSHTDVCFLLSGVWLFRTFISVAKRNFELFFAFHLATTCALTSATTCNYCVSVNTLPRFL